jgi:hypothetical protein
MLVPSVQLRPGASHVWNVCEDERRFMITGELASNLNVGLQSLFVTPIRVTIAAPVRGSGREQSIDR